MDFIKIFFDIDNIKNLDIKTAALLLIPLFFILMMIFRSISPHIKIFLISAILSFFASFLGSDKIPEPISKFIQHKVSSQDAKDNK